MGRKIGAEIDGTRLTVFGLSVASNVEAARFKIYIPPTQAQCFHFPSSAVCEQLDEIGKHWAVCPGRFSVLDERLNLFSRQKVAMRRSMPKKLDAGGGQGAFEQETFVGEVA